jgi:predicted ATPase
MFVVVTGGPGAGKTTLVEALRERGYARVQEAARAVIRDQVAIGGPAVRERDTELFAEIVLSWDMRNHREAAELPGPVFFDRALPDRVGFHVMRGTPAPPHVAAAVERFRYHRLVFVAPPWPEIYVHDEERTHDFDHARRAYDATIAGYARAGYEPVDLPKTDVAARVAFVLDRLGAAAPERPAIGAGC